jgi:hypothetical protein
MAVAAIPLDCTGNAVSIFRAAADRGSDAFSSSFDWGVTLEVERASVRSREGWLVRAGSRPGFYAPHGSLASGFEEQRSLLSTRIEKLPPESRQHGNEQPQLPRARLKTLISSTRELVHLVCVWPGVLSPGS